MDLYEPHNLESDHKSSNLLVAGGIDCDMHPAVPSLKALMPYMSDHWRDTAIQRGIHELDSISYPNNAPMTSRPDWRPEDGGKAGSDLDLMRGHILDPFKLSHAILNPLYGVQLIFSEDMANGFARALNDWTKHEWLDKDERLRASIIVPASNPEMAVEEINRCAADKRFVQVMLLSQDEMPAGRRHHWPIYEACVRHGLPIGFHAGSTYRHPVTPVGWPTYHAEDYNAQAIGFHNLLTSLVCEGVFAKFPEIKVVLIESGVTWLPAHLWRLTKFWRGLRADIPWVDRPPSEIVRDHVRLTLQPVDAPLDPDALERIIEHMGSDEMLLFSTDYPHWQYDGEEVLPEGLSADLVKKMMIDNPLTTYTRLNEGTS